MSGEKRTVTSAIDDMTVTEVRRDLDCLRKYWSFCEDNDRCIDTDYRLSTGKYDIQTFCLKFMMGHHMKRHNKSHRRSHVTNNHTEPEHHGHGGSDHVPSLPHHDA